MRKGWEGVKSSSGQGKPLEAKGQDKGFGNRRAENG